VSPLENLSDDGQNTYFAVSVQEKILSNLAPIADLEVALARWSFNIKAVRHLTCAKSAGRWSD
jgi:TolB-like protein